MSNTLRSGKPMRMPDREGTLATMIMTGARYNQYDASVADSEVSREAMHIERNLAQIDRADDSEWGWHQMTVTRPRQMDLHALFVTVFHSVGAENNESTRMMAMFSARESRSDNLVYYITPDTARLAPEFVRMVGARSCSRPTEAVRFEFGDERARALLRTKRR